MESLAVQLRNEIACTYNLGQIRSLCFELNIHYDEVRGETITEKAEFLILHCYSCGRLADLSERLCHSRPSAFSFLHTNPEYINRLALELDNRSSEFVNSQPNSTQILAELLPGQALVLTDLRTPLPSAGDAVETNQSGAAQRVRLLITHEQFDYLEGQALIERLESEKQIARSSLREISNSLEDWKRLHHHSEFNPKTARRRKVLVWAVVPQLMLLIYIGLRIVAGNETVLWGWLLVFMSVVLLAQAILLIKYLQEL